MPHKAGAIVVLGAPNDDKGNLSSMAVERCEQAVKEFRRHPDYRVLPTGGWGEHFNSTNKPHGHYIRQYLISRGIPEQAFLECVESGNTIEDAALSRPILDRHKITHVIVVTSDFHSKRARCLFERELPGKFINVAESVTDLPEDELEILKTHEDEALQKLKGKSTTR